MVGSHVTLQASPAPGVGGMYATAEGEGNPVKVAAQIPSLVEKQKVRDSVNR